MVFQTNITIVDCGCVLLSKTTKHYPWPHEALHINRLREGWGTFRLLCWYCQIQREFFLRTQQSPNRVSKERVSSGLRRKQSDVWTPSKRISHAVTASTWSITGRPRSGDLAFCLFSGKAAALSKFNLKDTTEIISKYGPPFLYSSDGIPCLPRIPPTSHIHKFSNTGSSCWKIHPEGNTFSQDEIFLGSPWLCCMKGTRHLFPRILKE